MECVSWENRQVHLISSKKILKCMHTINIYTHNAHNDRPTATIYPRRSMRDNISALLHPLPIPKGTNGRILVLQKKLAPVRTGGFRSQGCQHSFLRATYLF